eukprot:1144196-Pelagomonas_calceolata.AAC.1
MCRCRFGSGVDSLAASMGGMRMNDPSYSMPGSSGASAMIGGGGVQNLARSAHAPTRLPARCASSYM